MRGCIPGCRALLILFLVCTPVVAAFGAHPEGQWWPIAVKSHYGEYDATGKLPGKASTGLNRPKLEEWVPPGKVGKAYTVGVSFPHIKDSYWVAVNYGIVEEARRLGVGIRMLEAGGYDNLDRQLEQMRQLVGEKVDGLIVGAISYTGNDEEIERITDQGIPVVEVINDVRAPGVSAKAMVSFRDMGYYAGEFVSGHAEEKGLVGIRVLFFPGPKDSGWAPETFDGFQDAMEYFPGKVEVADVLWGDTGRAAQAGLIRAALDANPDIDYIVGNAVAAEVAADILRERGMEERTTVVATYIIPSLYDRIDAGEVAAAPSDLTVFQARMAVDMMVRILSGQRPGVDFPFRSGPFIPMVTPSNIHRYPYEGLFGPRGYEPVFWLAPGVSP